MEVKADLHIHTTLSPCGDIEMSPRNIVKKALERGVGIIAITDHNSTLQAPIIEKLGKREGLMVLCGAEITTKEEVHVIVLAPAPKELELLQSYLSSNLIKVPNNPNVFGYQLVVDEDENVIHQEDSLLIGAIDKSIEEVEQFAKSINALFIPAHIDKQQNSLIGQLGFLPPSLKPDALELSPRCVFESFISNNAYLRGNSFITSSDAHYCNQIGSAPCNLDIKEPTFEEVRRAIALLKK